MAHKKVISLSGGVGGAKLSEGLVELLPRDALSVIVNTGDDSEHYGLFVAPDIDTQLYTLSGRNDPVRGWGQRDESWRAMEVMRELGEPAWFNIGDKDLGLKLTRTIRMKRGDRLTDITADFSRAFGVKTRLLPMTDNKVSTIIRTASKDYEFHDWFVAQGGKPTATDILFDGAAEAKITPEVASALDDPDLTAIVVAPSNPYLSIAPILAVSGLREAIRAAKAPVIGISPIVGGRAIKGPTADMLKGFGVPVTAEAVAGLHADIFDGYIVDSSDTVNASAFADMGIAVQQADTMMIDLNAKACLARKALDFAEELRCR